ncbi:MAG: hypothetical protein BroJett003_01610 [Planctomycetota bacterium]|nr:MAG: hypothetical protein BroJett003_01610 [Planctomycetota bacterium]
MTSQAEARKPTMSGSTTVAAEPAADDAASAVLPSSASISCKSSIDQQGVFWVQYRGILNGIEVLSLTTSLYFPDYAPALCNQGADALCQYAMGEGTPVPFISISGNVISGTLTCQ